MELQEKILMDLKESIANKVDKSTIEAIKVIYGEIQRLPNKNNSDSSILKVLNKLKKNELDMLKYLNKSSSVFLNVLNSYVPYTEDISDQDIIDYIKDNIDFSKYGNKFAAIKDIKSYFKDDSLGSRIKSIIEKNFK